MMYKKTYFCLIISVFSVLKSMQFYTSVALYNKTSLTAVANAKKVSNFPSLCEHSQRVGFDKSTLDDCETFLLCAVS